MMSSIRSSLHFVLLTLISACVLAVQAHAAGPIEISSSQALAMQKAGDAVRFIDVRTTDQVDAVRARGRAAGLPIEK